LLQYVSVTRARRVQILISLAVVAVLAVAIAVAVSSGDDEPAKTKTTATTPAQDSLFAGIPSQGLALGRPDAPATLEEFVDPQCPFCAEYSKNVLPVVVKDYVKTGKLRLMLRPLAFIGQDSVKGARAVVAAGEQGKAWPFLEAIYANQGQENTGYMTDDFLKTMAQRAGADGAAILAASGSDQVTKALQEADARATQFGLDSTPSFLITVDSQKPRRLRSSLEPGPFTASLDKALGQ
jgi:protein-disulfide isomerase